MMIIGELAFIGQPMLCNLEQPERCISFNVFPQSFFYSILFFNPHLSL